MGLKQQLDQDLKTAMLAGDKTLVTTLRGLKSTILDAEISKRVRDSGLPDEEIIQVLSKEAKKRQESADLYKQAGDENRSQAELTEKAVITSYLPKQLDRDEVEKLVDQAIAEQGAEVANMGKIIGQVKASSKGSADGAVIADIVKQKLQV